MEDALLIIATVVGVFAIDALWVVAIVSDYRAGRIRIMLADIVVPIVGIVRGILVLTRNLR